MKINLLMSNIRLQNLVLPEFQREYVWNREQAKQLLVSLTNEYPVGGLLFWMTDNPPELKNVGELPDKLGAVQVILDGQQRLTTLYMLTTGEIPPYYNEEDIRTDVRDLYFNLDDGDFQYYQAVRMRNNPCWVRVVACFSGSDIDVFSIAQQVGGEDGDSADAFRLAQVYDENLKKLKSIQNVELPEQVVPDNATIDDAIDVFDRVNSLGTKLTEAELALTHVTGKWPEARRVLKAKLDTLKAAEFDFGLAFMTRGLVCTTTNHALYELIHTTPRPQLEKGWERLSRTVDYLLNILPGNAFVHSTSDLSSLNPLIPLIQYLNQNNLRFSTNEELRRAIHWFCTAQIHQRYGGQADSRLERDVTVVLREESPWASLLDQIADQRGRIDVSPNDFEGRGISHPLYRMTLILAKAHGAVDWFNGVPLGKTVGKRYQMHSHHIFPTSKLYRNGYSSGNHLHRQIVNAIANRAFLTEQSNIGISNSLPEEYLPLVEERYPGALKRQFIPMDEQLWRLENYGSFLAARREIISRKLNEFLTGLTSEPKEEAKLRPVSELIGLPEGPNLEFKSSLQWDVRQDTPNTGLRNEVLKTVAAFMNTDGGILLIGVEDSGSVFGLEKDLSTLKGSSEDEFLQLLTSLIVNAIGPQYSPFVVPNIENVDGKRVCSVDVSQAPEPVFMNGTKGTEFYIRFANTSRSLNPEETHDYIMNSGKW